MTFSKENMDVYPDLAANGPMRRIIIKLLETIVRINNESDTGEKPSLNKLEKLLAQTYGIMVMSFFTLDPNEYFPQAM